MEYYLIFLYNQDFKFHNCKLIGPSLLFYNLSKLHLDIGLLTKVSSINMSKCKLISINLLILNETL